MNENEKRILTLLNKSGPLTKPEICKTGQMGWATAVKLINRLTSSGIIEADGIMKRASGQGKHPEKYKLSSTYPLAVGVDVEYRQTKIILTNLRGEILAGNTLATPANLDFPELRKFLSSCLTNFLGEHNVNREKLAGIGIGLPGIGKESWVKHTANYSTELSLYLEEFLKTRVLVDINVRVYTVFEKWENRPNSQDDFMLVTIRSGIGSGIFINGCIYYGHQEHAGEIGHMTVNKNGTQCVCGRYGCLQTEVNQNYLYAQYLEKVQNQPKEAKESSASSISNPSQEDLLLNLPDLFTLARKGNPKAMEIINSSAKYLGKSLAHTQTVLNLPHIIISGHFGPDGDVLLQPLETEIRKRILTQMDFNLSYLPLENRGFTVGATLLILKDYFTDIPT